MTKRKPTPIIRKLPLIDGCCGDDRWRKFPGAVGFTDRTFRNRLGRSPEDRGKPAHARDVTTANRRKQGRSMTLVYKLLPCGIYASVYEREPGEYEALERRANAIHDTEDRVPVVSFATELRKALARKGMLQMDLADSLGVSHTMVSKWLRGAGLPNAENMRKVCDELGLDHLATRKAAGVDPQVIPSTADSEYAGASDAQRAFNGGMYRERRTA